MAEQPSSVEINQPIKHTQSQKLPMPTHTSSEEIWCECKLDIICFKKKLVSTNDNIHTNKPSLTPA